MTELSTSILIVDDDLDFLDLLTAEFSNIPDVRITTAESVKEAVELVAENNFNLIVSDWALSKQTAPEFLWRADDLLVDDVKIPVLFMSGSEKVSQTQRMRDLKHFEPVSFIVKSLGTSMIRLVGMQILKRFPAQQELEPCY